jgi:hypothetical protein
MDEKSPPQDVEEGDGSEHAEKGWILLTGEFEVLF